MNHHRYADLSRTLTRILSRRAVLRGLAGAGFGLGSLRLSDVAEGKKHKKQAKKKKKRGKTQQQTPQPVINQFGCADVGQPCFGDSALCCSGVCAGEPPRKGQPDTRVCAAHNAGFCSAEMDSCTVGGNVPCRPNCFCMRTTGNAGFCGGFSTVGQADCRVCAADADCQGEFGPSAACVVLDGAACGVICPTTGNTACMIPCL